MSTTLKAGAAERTITPPVGVDLSGYAGRPGPSTDVHDDLWCRVLVLDDGATRAAVVALDLLGTDFALDDAIRGAVSKAAGVPREHILINCSHTHAGPATTRLLGLGNGQQPYLAQLPGMVAATAGQAAAALTPARLSYGNTPAQIGINRRERTADGTITIGRNPTGLVDQEMRAVRVETADGAPVAVLFHHACHGTTLGGENLSITSEWMGAAAACLKSRVGAPPLFLQGCAGQTNPERSERSFEQIARSGARACDAVTRALVKAAPLSATPLRGALTRVELPLQDPPAAEVARARLAKAEADVARARQEGAHPYWVRALESLVTFSQSVVALSERGARDQTLPFAVQALAIGDLALVGLSGEVFLEFAHRIIAGSPFPRTWVLGYTNGCQCYVPTAEAFAEGGYEAEGSFEWYRTLPLAPPAGDETAAAAIRLLQEVRG